jgi:hypothetical protein
VKSLFQYLPKEFFLSFVTGIGLVLLISFYGQPRILQLLQRDNPQIDLHVYKLAADLTDRKIRATLTLLYVQYNKYENLVFTLYNWLGLLGSSN